VDSRPAVEGKERPTNCSARPQRGPRRANERRNANLLSAGSNGRRVSRRAFARPAVVALLRAGGCNAEVAVPVTENTGCVGGENAVRLPESVGRRSAREASRDGGP
jgi:hypothetical protein